MLRLWDLVTAFLSLLGTAPDVARAVEVDPAVLDACPGYNATNFKIDGPRLSANLVLAGKPCNVFGSDIKVLDLVVVYETGMLTADMAQQRLKMQLLMVAFPCPPHRYPHSSQDHRRIQRTLRSPQVCLPATLRGPECAPRCSANQVYIHLGAVLIQHLSRQHRRGAVHDRTLPAHLRAAVPAPKDGASTHGEHLRPRRAL